VLSQRSTYIALDARYIGGSNEPLRRYGHSKLSKMEACRQLGFDVTRNSAIPSADPENQTRSVSDHPLRRYGHSRILGAYGTPIWGKRGCRGSAMAPFERAMVVSYRLSIVTVALSVTIRPQFAIECLRRSNRQGVGQFWRKFPGVPLGVDP